jgi:thioredoxin reductase (NADPH)
MIGADAVTHWLPPQLQRENGYVRTGREVSDRPGWAADRAPFLLETNLPGFFCVGDIRYNSIKRVSSSVGEGSMAVAFVLQYLSLLLKPINRDVAIIEYRRFVRTCLLSTSYTNCGARKST